MRFAYPPYSIRQLNRVEAGRVDKALAPHPPTIPEKVDALRLSTLLHPSIESG